MIAVGEEIPGINLQALTGVSSSPFQWKLLSLFVLTALFIALALMVPSIPWILPSVALGLMYAHAVELQHQCLHNTALRDTSWNRRIGILLGLPLLVSFSDYQNSHMRHHKLLGTPEDREFFNYGYESLTTLRALIPHLLMIRHYCDVAVFMAKAGVGKITRPDATLRMALRIRSEYRIMAIFLIVMLVITIVFQTTIFLKIWLIPLLVGIPAHALIELPEHIGCNIRTQNVLSNTRTIKASKFGVWFTNGNNYHVEHHWLPGVPNDKFPELHSLITPKGIENLDVSYWSFYSDFLKQLFNNTLKRR
jgi:fatty acid desaturase